MTNEEFRVTMIDPDGGEFVAGSPEVVARLTAQGYTQRTEESDAQADEQEEAAAAVPGPKTEEPVTHGSGPVDGSNSATDKPGPVAAPKPGSKASGSK